MKFVYKKEKGFTLIELVISIFILSVAVVGIFGAFSMITILTGNAANRLTATYVAQEGMEIVRNIRDTNWLNMLLLSGGNYTWLDGLSNCANGCEADYKTTATNMIPWSSPGGYLNINANGFYAYDPNNNSPTIFKRKITITCLPSGDCATDYIAKVSVEVSWSEKANVLYPGRLADPDTCNPSNCIAAEGTLYDWYNYVPPTQP